MVSLRMQSFALLACAVLVAASGACLAAEASGEAGNEASSQVGFLRKLLFAVEIPIAQGRCAGVFTREMIPCYLSQYGPTSSFA